MSLPLRQIRIIGNMGGNMGGNTGRTSAYYGVGFLHSD
jgi:hypothetical protein